MSTTMKIVTFPGTSGTYYQRMTLSEFSVQLKINIDALIRSIEIARRIYGQFDQFAEVWPDQCDRLGNALRGFNVSLQRISDLLGKAETLPESVITLRFRLIVALNYQSDQVDQAMHNLQSLRAVCRSNNRQSLKTRQTIQQILPSILEEADNLKSEFLALFDRARFLEHELRGK